MKTVCLACTDTLFRFEKDNELPRRPRGIHRHLIDDQMYMIGPDYNQHCSLLRGSFVFSSSHRFDLVYLAESELRRKQVFLACVNVEIAPSYTLHLFDASADRDIEYLQRSLIESEAFPDLTYRRWQPLEISLPLAA